MPKFFINRPIVAMVISILMVITGLIAMFSLPIAQFPDIAPPEVQISANYTGADALTVEQSVATPIEQQMSGVDNMDYMYSINTNGGTMTLRDTFKLGTEPNTDQILAQLRVSQALSQLPVSVQNLGVTVQKSLASPLVVFALYSPKSTYDNIFLANYAYININDQMTRIPGIASVTVFGAGQYAMRIWVKPDQLSKLNITVPEIVNAVNSQNTVNPAGKIGGEPVPPGQEFTYAVRAQGRLETEQDFGNIVVRAEPDGSIIRVKDIAHVELGAQTYSYIGHMDGKPTALIALYQLPGSNSLQAVEGAKKKMEELKSRFPQDLDYAVALDTTTPVTEGMDEIVTTLFEALALVIVVVYLFLQGWRTTLIPLLAVPVSLVGTFLVFPLLGFSINTISLLGLVLAIGLVVDDAIVVVEAVEHHIEQGLSPKDAALKAMQEVSGPIVAIALILTAVFLPTAFIPGITGELYRQFAITLSVSVIISAFNALSLSPALSALMLKPKSEHKSNSLLQKFFDRFNQVFGAATNGYVNICGLLIRKMAMTLLILLGVTLCAGILGKSIPGGFLPDEDQGYLYGSVQLPDASSLQRTDAVVKKVTDILKKIPGFSNVATVSGFNLISGAQSTYNAVFFIHLKPWHERTEPEERYEAVKMNINKAMASIPEAIGFAFPPPAIPGVGSSGGATMVLEDRAGRDVEFLAENTKKFLEAAQKRPEVAMVSTTLIPATPQMYVDIDQDKVLKQGIKLSDLYTVLQAYMGSGFINYFNRFGRQWQVYVQADGAYRKDEKGLGEFYVRNNDGVNVPLSTVLTVHKVYGPEFTMRYNLFRSAQINASAKPGYSSAQLMAALEEVFEETMPKEMGYDYMGMSYQEKKAQQGIPPMAVFGFSLLCVFLILAAQYESWSLPFSVLLGTPIAVAGAYLGLKLSGFDNNVYAQIGLVMLIGLAAKNAILIVEFARAGVDSGKPVVDAALEAARIRLRPILMTSFAFILGCVPLALASGAGALARNVLGFVVIGGMLAASLISIFMTPALFYFIENTANKSKHKNDMGAGEVNHD